MSEKLLTLEKAAEYLDVHPGTLYRWARIKRVPAVKVGRVWRFRIENLEDWFDKKTVEITEVKDKSIIEGIEKKKLSETAATLLGTKISLRTRIRQYQHRAREIEEYLSKYPERWGKFQEEFNFKVDNIFRQIMEYEREQLNLGRPEKVNKLKKIFIKRIREIFLKGAYNRWSLNKPYGYAGDFKIIDDIYQNSPVTNGFDRLFDNYFQMSAISIAVRNRKEDFKRVIVDLAKTRPEENLQVMDLACGSCRAIKEITCLDGLITKNVIFDCYDHEERALVFARELLDTTPKVNFIKGNLLRICLAKNINTKIKERYDMIYATGFFDYLSNRMSVKLIKNLRNLLKKNGLMAISNVRDRYSNPSVHYMEWVGDWNLVYRSDEEFKKIFIDAGFKENELKIQYEQQGIMQYIIASNLKP
jgi:extracellular factor (EF) 3-hydroxypalmitic acid methyl ester biosynthesis protein